MISETFNTETKEYERTVTFSLENVIQSANARSNFYNYVRFYNLSTDMLNLYAEMFDMTKDEFQSNADCKMLSSEMHSVTCSEKHAHKIVADALRCFADALEADDTDYYDCDFMNKITQSLYRQMHYDKNVS
jgi:hypothetical protein